MVVRNSRTKKMAMMKAARARRKGFDAQIFKKEKGYGTSITRMKKR